MKHWYLTTSLYDVTTQKTSTSIFTAVKTSKPAVNTFIIDLNAAHISHDTNKNIFCYKNNYYYYYDYYYVKHYFEDLRANTHTHK
jgi:hypothetical protein